MDRLKEFDVVISVAGSLRRLAKIRFAVDGSIYVFFPGFVSTNGILGRIKLRAGQTYPTNIDLADGGKISSHLVKYAHHPDGEAHFSQDGKVKTEVRRKAAPLGDQTGHLFTIQVQNFLSFPILKTSKKSKLVVNLTNDVVAIKLVGWRYRLTDLTLPDNVPPGAAFGLTAPDGIVRIGKLVLPPQNTPFDDVALFLSVEATPPLSQDLSAHLLFMGAFDPSSISLNHKSDTEFIAFAYPCSDFEALKRNLGSIDLVSHADKDDATKNA